MNKKGHIKFALSLSPLFFKPLNIHLNLIEKYNQFVFDLKSVFIVESIKNNAVFMFSHIKLMILTLFFYLFGAIIPDIDLWFRYFFDDKNKQKRYLYHRQFTHSLAFWIIAFVFLLRNYTHDYFFVLVFILGVFTHLLGDMLTGTIPILFYGKYYHTFSRIGITMFFKNTKCKKSKINLFFTQKFPFYLNKAILPYILIFILMWRVSFA